MINKLYRSKRYPLIFQILALTVFIFLIIGSIGITTDNADFAKYLRNTNLSNLIVWSYWWPLIVLTAVFFGRHWCSICPIELLIAITSRIGLKRKVPQFIKSGWMITILYALIAIVAIHTWGIHRYPNRMAFYLLFLMGLAVLLALVFEKRAFCSYFCPVGKLLGLYSLLSRFGLRIKNQNTCDTCITKDCIHKTNHNKLIGRSCTSNLYPACISDNRTCILCTQCVKSCTKDNISLKNIPNSYLKFDSRQLTWSEIGMLMILLGFVCYEILSSWKISDSIIRSIPVYLEKLLAIKNIPNGFFEAIVLFILVPFLFLLITSGILKLLGNQSWKYYLQKIAIHLLPLVAFGHVFKALLKTSSRIPYWKYAIEKPNGIYYATRLLNKELILPPIDWLNGLVILIGICGLCYASWLSMKKLDSNDSNKWFFYLLIIFHFMILNFGPIASIFL